RPNVACGAKRNPEVFCASQGQSPSGDAPIEKLAALVANGRLTDIEPLLRSEVNGFANRFAGRLGAAIRQPDAYWFDESFAETIEKEGHASSKEAVALLAQ